MPEPIDLEYADNGNIIIHSRKSQAERSEVGPHVISARNKDKVQNNQPVDDCKKDDEEISITDTLNDSLLISESLEENGGSSKKKKKKKKKKNGKKKHKKNKKKNKKNKTKNITRSCKSYERAKNMPFHFDEDINGIIKQRFSNLKIKKIPSTDSEFVDIIIKIYEDYILYNPEENQWLWYTGKRWKIDTEFVVYNYVLKTVCEINHIFEKSDTDKSDLKQASLYCNHHFIVNLIGMLKTKCVCHSDDFDQCSYKANLNNGTLNLTTGKLKKHRPEDMITKFINIDYIENAIGNRFEKFILEICDYDEDLAEYLQVMYGYAFTGETREQCFFMEKGNGANGKSTLNEVIAEVVEEYTDRVDFSLFQKKQYASANAPTPELAKLKGKHIVFCSETNDNQVNEAKIKEITGGTRITARALHKSPFSYIPKFTIIFDGNTLPTIKGVDHGIWRRIVVVPFNCKFDKDVTLKDTLLQEKEAILKWLVDGAYKYYKNGLPVCKAVKKATKQYRLEENTVESFVKHGIVEDPESKCAAKALYTEYERYCNNCCSSPVDIKTFKAAMNTQGYISKRSNKGVFWIGIRLRNDTNE